MNWFKRHIRNTMLAGLLAAVPVIILIWAAVWIEMHTHFITEYLGFHLPGLGFVFALAAVYVLGLIVTSFLGKALLLVLDKVLELIPGFHHLYHAWKDMVLLPKARASTFHQVVLVTGPDGKRAQFGFWSGEALPEDPQTCLVFLPNIPNPLSGKLMLFDRACCLPVKMSVAEAFKLLLSTGNYLPADLHGLCAPLNKNVQGSPTQ